MVSHNHMVMDQDENMHNAFYDSVHDGDAEGLDSTFPVHVGDEELEHSLLLSTSNENKDEAMSKCKETSSKFTVIATSLIVGFLACAIGAVVAWAITASAYEKAN